MKHSVEERGRVSRRDILRGFGAFGLAAATSRAASAAIPSDSPIVQPLRPVRFAVIGDWGNGKAGQMAIGKRLALAHGVTPFELVVSVGDNIYPSGDAEDFGHKFERPYADLIKHRVPFFTVFGNHDVRKGREAQLRYPLFNMGGRNYYTVRRGDGMIELFMLDSTAMDARQIDWVDKSLAASSALWKVVVVHHPPYSSAKKHGSAMDIRRAIEPLLVRHGVSAVFSGDDHVYQRVAPQQGVQYFVTGAAGKIRHGDLKRDGLVAAGYDEANHFMVVEATLGGLEYRALDEDGRTLDTGVIAPRLSTVARLFDGIARRF